MEKVLIMIPVLIVVGGLGVTIGMYISSQIKSDIEKRTINFKKSMKEYEQKKRKN